MKEYSTLLTALELEPHFWMQFCVTPKIHLFCGEGVLIVLQGIWLAYSKPCRWSCILVMISLLSHLWWYDELDIDNLKICLIYLSYLNIVTHYHNYLSVRNTIRRFVAKEMYHSLIFLSKFDWMQKWLETLKVTVSEKVLSNSWSVFWYKLRVLNRMEAVVWRLTSRYDIVGYTTQGLLGWKLLPLGNKRENLALPTYFMCYFGQKLLCNTRNYWPSSHFFALITFFVLNKFS